MTTNKMTITQVKSRAAAKVNGTTSTRKNAKRVAPKNTPMNKWPALAKARFTFVGALTEEAKMAGEVGQKTASYARLLLAKIPRHVLLTKKKADVGDNSLPAWDVMQEERKALFVMLKDAGYSNPSVPWPRVIKWVAAHDDKGKPFPKSTRAPRSAQQRFVDTVVQAYKSVMADKEAGKALVAQAKLLEPILIAFKRSDVLEAAASEA